MNFRSVKNEQKYYNSINTSLSTVKNFMPCCTRSIPLHSPNRDEIKKAIIQLNNSKSAGPDGIPAEALKADLETSADMLQPLFELMWEKEEVPQDWKEGYIVKLPKKGDLGLCKNYIGIMLLSVPGKVFNRVI